MTRKVAFGMPVLAALILVAVVSIQAQEASRLSRSDQLLAGAQQICPVMGKDLSAMGGPVKAEFGEQTLFLCCEGCFDGQVQKKHWNTIQANLQAAQGTCPVMGKPLPKRPASTVVRGRRVFVCCPPCTQKVKAEPEKYLAKLDRQLEVNLER